MPRPKKAPRLWFRPERFDKAGKRVSGAQWYILDGAKQVPTGCALGEEDEANRQLAEYNLARYQPARRINDIEDIDVAEVLSIYDTDCRETQANKRTFDGRILRLAEWWGGKMLAEVNGQSCRDYAKARGNAGGARRDLEDLRAAINHHSREGLHRGAVRVVLPERGPARQRWLTRSEAAKLIWAAWRFRETQRRHRGSATGSKRPTKRRPLRHVARFILLALYTGTRAGAVAAASPYRSEGRSWVDLDAGLYYRLQEGRKATNKRQPPVRLPTGLLAHLRRWKERSIATSHFVEHNGRPVHSVNKGFQHAVELAGIEGNVTPHVLRHTSATWLMQNGVEIWEAAGFLGMSEKVLRETYGHHHPDFQRNAAAGFRRRRTVSNETPTKQSNKDGTEANKSIQSDEEI